MSSESKPVPTLYAWSGGNEALENLTKAFYKKVGEDNLLKHVFGKMDPNHAQHVAHFIGEVFGGPKRYTEDDKSSHAKMIAHHIGRMLTEEQRKHWMALLLETADEVGLPKDPEYRSALVGYLEWGSRLAVINSNASENPVGEGEPMPKWGWGETGGPYQP
ncbi:MAG: group II truncated hemoglobin [Chryseolinea sp.]